MTTDVQLDTLGGRIRAVRPLPHAKGCCVHLEDRYTGYTESIVLKIKHAEADLPAELFEVVLYHDQALELVAALTKAVRDQLRGW